jgi:hypothetical protein
MKTAAKRKTRSRAAFEAEYRSALSEYAQAKAMAWALMSRRSSLTASEEAWA